MCYSVPCDFFSHLFKDLNTPKMYKRNYWEDPAYAWRLRHFGLDLARDAAYENLFERDSKEHEQQPPPQMILFCRLVGLRPCLIRKKI